MPIIKSTAAPKYELPGLKVTGLAAPSRGSKETSVWRIALAPNTPGTMHSVDREEIFIALSGDAEITLAHETLRVSAGDALVIPAGQAFSLANNSGRPFEAIVALPVGGKASMPSGESFVPPWAA